MKSIVYRVKKILCRSHEKAQGLEHVVDNVHRSRAYKHVKIQVVFTLRFLSSVQYMCLENHKKTAINLFNQLYPAGIGPTCVDGSEHS